MIWISIQEKEEGREIGDRVSIVLISNIWSQFYNNYFLSS